MVWRVKKRQDIENEKHKKGRNKDSIREGVNTESVGN